MSTDFENLLNRGSALVDKASPATVTIQGFPAPLEANIGPIFRKSVWTENGYRLQVRGTVEIRREILTQSAPGVADPVTGTELVVRGKTYRVDFTAGDTITLRIEFASFS